MASKLKVNPTRMELRRLKDRKKTAVRGHKLLKDKSDEMIRQFIGYAKENMRLRLEVEQGLSNALAEFMLAKSVSQDGVIWEALSMPSIGMELEIGTKNIMSVNVPSIGIKKSESTSLYPYSFASVTSEDHKSISTISVLAEKLIKIAEVEKTCNMLATEIEKNRRRVNALEYIMIPQTEEAIHDITMKLDENERGNIVRLMKVKTMLANRE